MKPRKSTMLVALVALLLAAFAIGMAQGTTQTEQKKKESCCAESAKGCAEGADSCKHDPAGSADSTRDKEGKSCCGDESCDMDHAQGDAKGGDAKAKHKHGEGDCCKAKQKDKDKTRTKKTA